MKRKFIGLAIVVLAASLSAFTLPKKPSASFGNYYWFELDGTGMPYAASHLIYQSWDPSGCTFAGDGDPCEGAFSSYTYTPGGAYPYYPAGIWITEDYTDF